MPRKDGSTLEDANADLIGVAFDSDLGMLVVTGSMAGLPSYVECDGKRGVKTCRPVALVRAAKLAGWL